MEVEVREEAVPTTPEALLLPPSSSTFQQQQHHRHLSPPASSSLDLLQPPAQNDVNIINANINSNNASSPYPVQVYLCVADTTAPVVIVRAEEILLVVLVLIIWVAAIALFFNRWGKIRMLEPYQPKFQQAHRPSCPLAPLSPPGLNPIQQRMSFSKYNVNCFTDGIYGGIPSPNPPKRPRLNSAFVGSPAMAVINPPPRRVKSAMDIQHLIINERPLSTGFNSMLPLRRPSITIERPPITQQQQQHQHQRSFDRSSSVFDRNSSVFDRATMFDRASINERSNYERSMLIERTPAMVARRRPSTSIERPYLSHYQQFRARRTSCFVSKAGSTTSNKNFTSFENNKPSCSFHQPTISFETSTTTSSMEQPTVIIETHHLMSRSFESPRKAQDKAPKRMSVSLDVNPLASFERKMSIPEEEVEPPVVITLLDETQITAPLLEGLKSSDV